jgi:hypothetical protein
LLSSFLLNNQMISLLNLPKPSDNLMSMIVSHLDTLKFSNNAKTYYDLTQQGKVNCCEGQIFQCSPLITMQMYKEFYPHIKMKFLTTIGIFKNTDLTKLAYLPPHIDATRKLVLNYVIDEGGKNTLTSMYKMNCSKSTLPRDIQMISYENLDLSFSVKTLKDNWYATDVQNYHSVDNIETQRVILTISFSDINYSYFKNKYNNFIVNEWLLDLGSNQGPID